MASVEAHKRLYMYLQKDSTNNQMYHCKFMAHIKTIETYGGASTLDFVPSLVQAKLKCMETAGIIASAKSATDAKKSLVRTTICDEYLAVMLLS